MDTDEYFDPDDDIDLWNPNIWEIIKPMLTAADDERINRKVIQQHPSLAGIFAEMNPSQSGSRVPREPCRSGDEQDVIHARKFLVWSTHGHASRKAKRAIRRRERHNWKKEL
jgi:hypothetical protein